MKIMNTLRKYFNKGYVRTACMASFVMSALTLSTFAADEMQSMTTVLTTSFQSMITEMLAAISAVLPITMSLLGCSLLVAFGIKWFKKIVGQS